MTVFSLLKKIVFSSVLCFIGVYHSFGQDTYYFDTPGEDVFVVPEGVKSVKIEAWGAGGEGGFAAWLFSFLFSAKGEGGGGGAYSHSSFDVEEGDEFQIFVGAGGGNKGNGRGGEERGDSTFVSGLMDGSSSVLVLAKGGLPGDGALTKSNPSDGIYLRGGQADEGIGQMRFSGGNGATFEGTTRDNYTSGGSGGAAGIDGDGGHAGNPANYNHGYANTGGGDGGDGVNTGNRNPPTEGEPGVFPGGGGGGAKNGATNQITYGGQGGHGRVIITTYMSPLNILLKGIHVKNVGLTNIVSWETAREDFGDAFEIERSSDGNHFDKVAYLPAHGANHGSRYSYMDENALAGINYYRLNVLNVDGSTYKSDIVATRIDNNADVWEIKAYPNPVSSILNINIIGQSAGLHQTSMIDMSGKIVYEHETNNPETLMIDMTGWPSGIYMIHSKDAKVVQTIKVNKE